MALFGFFLDFFGPFSIFSYIFLASAFNFHARGASLAPIGLRLGSLKSLFAFFLIFLYIRKYRNIYTEIHETFSGGPQVDAPLAPSSSARLFHIGYACFEAPAWLFGKSRLFSAYFLIHIYICEGAYICMSACMHAHTYIPKTSKNLNADAFVLRILMSIHT